MKIKEEKKQIFTKKTTMPGRRKGERKYSVQRVVRIYYFNSK